MKTYKPAKIKNLQLGDMIRFIYEGNLNSVRLMVTQIDCLNETYCCSSLSGTIKFTDTNHPFVISQESNPDLVQKLTLDFLKS